MKGFFLLAVLLALTSCGNKGFNLGPYSIGRDKTWYPLELGTENDKLTAFSNAIVQEIGKDEQIPLNLVDINWIQLFELLDQGDVGGILTPLSPNVITSNKYTFSHPLINLGSVLIVPTASQATTLADLKDKIIGVYQYDDSTLLVQQYPELIIKLYQSKPRILEELAAGRVDAVLMPILDAEELVPYISPNTMKIVSQPLTNKAIRLVCLKDKNSSLIKYFNRGLEKLRSSGKYRSLRESFAL